MNPALMRLTEKLDAELPLDQDHVLHRMAFFLAALLAFLLIRIGWRPWIRRSVPSWQKGGSSLGWAPLLPRSRSAHGVVLIALPIAPCSGLVHPQGFSGSFAARAIRCGSIDWPYFVAGRTDVHAPLAGHWF